MMLAMLGGWGCITCIPGGGLQDLKGEKLNNMLDKAKYNVAFLAERQLKA